MHDLEQSRDYYRRNIHNPDVDLTAHESKIAMMRAAGTSEVAISMLLECSRENVIQVIRRPRVANYILKLRAFMGTGIQEGLADVNQAIDDVAARAFQVEVENMEALHDMGMDQEIKHGDRIKAKQSASSIAQDILDRSGKRAPTRVVTMNGKIPQEALEQLANVAKEMRGVIDVTKD